MKTQTGSVAVGSEEHQTIYDLLKNELACSYSDLAAINNEIQEMIKAAYHEDLQDLLVDHLHKGRLQLLRLSRILDRFGIRPNEDNVSEPPFTVTTIRACMSRFDEGSARDASFIVCLKKACHARLAAYESISSLFEIMGYFKMSEDLKESAKEEKECLQSLIPLEDQIFGDAYENSVYQEMDGDE